MASSEQPELMGNGKFEVVSGSWSRWYEGRRVLHDSDNMTRVVENVTVSEYRVREHQLRAVSSVGDLAEIFQPNRVSHGTVVEARAEIKRATKNDVDALHRLFSMDLHASVRESLRARCAKLDSPVNDSE